MKFEKKIEDYLSGLKLSEGILIKISEHETYIISRDNYINDKVIDTNVIDIGCCDHVHLIEEKIAKNNWLHSKIRLKAKFCLGIDNNEEGIRFLKDRLGLDNVICADITKDIIPEINQKKWNYIIMGDILEHIDDPVSFLKSIKNKYTNNVKQMIITVPNAFSYSNFSLVKKHLEVINSDHKFWFTPYTLSKILSQAGFKINEFHFAQEISKKTGLRAKLMIYPFLKKQLIYHRLLKYPALRETLIILADF
jgi:2-polyprenyl-3-methyl-5-hydroxy-6-metoxy-1,4-benzoquinol methylase